MPAQLLMGVLFGVRPALHCWIAQDLLANVHLNAEVGLVNPCRFQHEFDLDLGAVLKAVYVPWLPDGLKVRMLSGRLICGAFVAL